MIRGRKRPPIKTYTITPAQKPAAIWRAIGFALVNILIASCAHNPASGDGDFAIPPLPASDMAIWFNAPATDWESEGLPIGNGSMGAMILGGTGQDRLQFNEKSLWTGGPGSVQGYDYGLPSESMAEAVNNLGERILADGPVSPDQAASLIGRKTSGYGHYQNFGTLVVQGLPDIQSGYVRELDLDNGLASITYATPGNHQISQSYFASYPDQVIVARYETTDPEGFDISVGLDIPENRSVSYDRVDDLWVTSGALNDNGLQWAAGLHVQADGGQIRFGEDSLGLENAQVITIRLTLATDHALTHPHYRGEPPKPLVIDRLTALKTRSFEALKTRHIDDHRAMMSGLQLSLGGERPMRPTPDLLSDWPDLPDDDARYLETLFFQYGRYLLAASSRPGSLPANLQGVWNDKEYPPWNDDYHVNINLQMNYWPAHMLNLPGTEQPYIDFVSHLSGAGQESARLIWDAPGWSVFLNTNVFGFTGLIDWPTAFWQPEGAAWLSRIIYDHYLFTGDEDYLKDTAWPIVKGASDFWLASLKRDPRDGLWVVSPSFSPEHGEFTAGSAMSQQIVWDLLSNTQEAAEILGYDSDAHTLAETLAQLDPGLRIGRWGQLQEWKEDADDPDSQHRHMSHLFALHPGRQINTQTMDELLDAARTSLNARGDSGTGWSKAWKINLWARLRDGDRAHRLLSELLRDSTLPNLLDTHPPFQIDGNFGASSGMGEMLLQSHQGDIDLLPALPSAWRSGGVDGFVARGGYEVDIRWRDGQLTHLRLTSRQAGEVRLRYDGFDPDLRIWDAKNGRTIIPVVTGDRLTFSGQMDGRYVLVQPRSASTP